ncbi:MAG TPA: energy-coupling factor transporter ATPase [Bacillota bacterium]|nr:energy-coupling factor transporter ATPase [Bacillota bacterium]
MGIEFKKVSYRYMKGNAAFFQAINNISLEIDNLDEFICLVGQTGSGKSTLVQHMNALIFPSEGEVVIDGVVITSKRDKKIDYNSLRKHVGLVFQFPEYQLFEETVEKDVMFGPLNFKMTKEEAAKAAHVALEQVGLDDTYLERSPLNLSGGEKKRVSIAGILALNPDVLVLDEPTSGLDPAGKRRLMELLSSIKKETGKTIVLITHDMDLVYQYASRVLVLNTGNLVFDGTPDKLFRRDDLVKNHLDYPGTIKTLKAVREKFGVDIDIYKKTPEEAAREIRRVMEK